MRILASPETGDAILPEVLDALEGEVVLLDKFGMIVMVNEAFVEFGQRNGLDDPAALLGADYLKVTLQAGVEGDQHASRVAIGIRSVLEGSSGRFEAVYPCHSPMKKRWFRLVVTPWRQGALLVHEDTTSQHIAQLAILRAAGYGPPPLYVTEPVDLEPMLQAWAMTIEAAIGRAVVVESLNQSMAIVDAHSLVEGLTRLVLQAPRNTPDPIIVRGAKLTGSELIEVTGLGETSPSALDALLTAVGPHMRTHMVSRADGLSVQLIVQRARAPSTD